MKKLKMGTPQMGIAIGLTLVCAAVLVMLIGFWKALLLVALFALGYFIGTVENKQKFIKDTANKIIPAKETKVIDIKSAITREQQDAQAGQESEAAEPADEEPAQVFEEDNADKTDGE